MSSIRFCFKSFTGDVSKKALFFCRFLRFFAFAFKTLMFLVLAFPFVGFEFQCYFCFVCSCCCLWSGLTNQVFIVLGFLGFLCGIVFLFFACFVVCFFFFFMEGLRVQVRWPKVPNWPKKKDSHGRVLVVIVAV